MADLTRKVESELRNQGTKVFGLREFNLRLNGLIPQFPYPYCS